MLLPALARGHSEIALQMIFGPFHVAWDEAFDYSDGCHEIRRFFIVAVPLASRRTGDPDDPVSEKWPSRQPTPPPAKSCISRYNNS